MYRAFGEVQTACPFSDLRIQLLGLL